MKYGVRSSPAKFWATCAVGSVFDCWLWKGKSNPHRMGYGSLMWKGKKDQKAHRIAYALAFGPIPPGLSVCHKCDVPACVNPYHLFLGTAKDNIHDGIKKGRITFDHLPKGHNKGTRNGQSVLSEAQVLEIKNLKREKRGDYSRWARQYGVSPATIRNIYMGITWGHISCQSTTPLK